MDGNPIVRIAVGSYKQEATNAQWSDTATGRGVSLTAQHHLVTAMAAAFADPASAAGWS